MGIFSFLGNVGAGIQGSRMGKKQMELGQGMIDQASQLSQSFQRPEMQTPAAINMMMELASGKRYQNMPGLNMAENQLGQSTAAGVRAMGKAGTGAEAFGGIAQLYANQMQGQQNLGIQNAQFQDQAQNQYMQDLQGLGQWQQQGWNWNKADPYLQAQQKAAQLDTMGRQGQWEGLKNKMGSWAEAFQGAGGALDKTAGEAATGLLKPGSKLAGIIPGLFAS